MKTTKKLGKLRKHHSYSSLNEYLICPLKYYFHRVEKREGEFISANLLLGKAMHGVYAQLMDELYSKEKSLSSPEDLQAIFERLFTGMIEEEEKEIRYGKSDYEEYLENGKGYVVALQEYFQEKEVEGEELWLERDFMVPLATRDKVHELPLTGIFDSVVTDHDRKLITVIDFKTSSRRYADWKLRRNLQSLIYLYSARLLGDSEYDLLFRWEVLLKYKTPKIVEYEHLWNRELVLFLSQVVEKVEEAIKSEIFYPNPSFFCANCEYQMACRDWPGRGE